MKITEILGILKMRKNTGNLYKIIKGCGNPEKIKRYFRILENLEILRNPLISWKALRERYAKDACMSRGVGIEHFSRI